MSQVVDGVDVPCGLCLACKMISDAEGPAGGLEGLGMQLAAAGSRHIFCVLCVCASVPNVDGHHMHAPCSLLRGPFVSGPTIRKQSRNPFKSVFMFVFWVDAD